MRLLEHNRTRGARSRRRLGGALAGCALSAASACTSFDAHANPAYGCDECQAPDHCVHGFCVRSEARPPHDAGAHDAGKHDAGLRDAAVHDGASGALACEPGASAVCYDGRAGSEQHPPCRTGLQTCEADGGLGPCRGQVVPMAEQCNRVDDDCDGQSDEDFDLGRDPEQCGGCGIHCAPGEACCDGTCIDLSADDQHCGRCGQRCARGTSCCSGQCVDTGGDPSHCGACSTRCADAESCCGGVCVDAQNDRDHCGPFCLNCAAGEACCFGACADLDSFQHCGSCERVCGNNEQCCSGQCSTVVCR